MTWEAEILLNNEMGQIEALHEKELNLWKEVKAYYESAATVNIQNLQASKQMSTEHIKILFQTKRGNSKRHSIEDGLDG